MNEKPIPMWQQPPWLAFAMCLVMIGCDWDCNRVGTAPPRIDPQQGPGAAAAPPPLAVRPEGAQGARPSTDENMGRSFEGVIELRSSARAGARRLRYLSRGNDARLQVDGMGGRDDFDALIWGESVSIIDNERQTYRTFALDSIETTAEERRVHVRKTGELT